MINPIVVPLIISGAFVAFKKITKKKKRRQFSAPPTHQLPS